MIVYLANKEKFREDILSNRIEEIVHDSFKGVLGKSVSPNELASWKNSLRHMDTMQEDSGIPDNASVAIEFNIPQTGKHADFIVTGTLKKSRTSNLFVGSGAFTETPPNPFQGLIVDEAHRLNEKSGLFSNLGENQIKELIAASTFYA